MGCCGNNHSKPVTPPGQKSNPEEPVRPLTTEEVYFKYTGSTALKVAGIFSRRIYHFPEHGSVVAADRRDAASLMAVPNLRRISKPE